MSTFKRFAADDIVSANPTEVTTGIWTGDTGSLTAFYTASSQAASSTSGQYYWNVYNLDANSNSSAEVQFAVAYGHATGGGNKDLTVDDSATLSTLATYQQYRNLLLEPEDSQFTFDGGYNSDQIYVINIARARLRETLDPGNWMLTLSGSSGRFTFVDDSGQTLGQSYGRSGAVYNVVSGSLSGSAGLTVAATTSSAFGGFGLVYPGLGIIVLNPNAIKSVIGMATATILTNVGGKTPFAPNTGTLQTEYNHAGLYYAIKLGGDFQARSAETISSTHYFVRLRNKEFNYSNNPSFYDSSNGTLISNDFIQDPRVYVTTIGLFNDNNECVAVAKLSQPVPKSFSSEVNVTCRLDF